MNEKQREPLKKDIVTLATLLSETDHEAGKVLQQETDDSADLLVLRNCVEKLNKYVAQQKWEKNYVPLENSIVQGKTALEAVQQTLEKKDVDVRGQYKLLSELKDKIGTDPSNRDLLERVEQLQKTITPDADKTGDILSLGKELEKVVRQRREELQKDNGLKQLVNYLLIMVLYEQRLGLNALTKPNALAWSRLAQELGISALPERERKNLFAFLGEQKLAPAARMIHDSLLTALSEVEEKTYDFSKKENRQAVKKDAITKLKKITKLEELCHEALHENSDQYKELMEAQNALLTEGAEEMPLREMQEKLQTLQKAAQRYMETRMEQGGIFGVPRREARLVYAAAVYKFAQKFSLQLNEAMKCRDVEALDLPADVAKQYIQNSFKALDLVVKEQTGVDLSQEKEAPVKKAVLESNRQ